jgi:hypothetical protein
MDEPELERTPLSVSARSGPPPLWPIAAIGVLIIAGIAGYVWWVSRTEPPPTNARAAVLSTEAPLSSKPARTPVVLPPLDEMDPFLRALLGRLTSRPELAAWLATDHLMQQLAAAIDVAARGQSPAPDFKVLAPKSRLATTARGRQRYIDPAAYRRYNGLVEAVTSVDPAAAARAYQTVRPRLNEAYQKRGHPGGDVDQAVKQALALLAATPVPRDPIALAAGPGARWIFADAKLESLTASQKQVVRMGPENAEKLVAWLRVLSDQLGG